jgi:type II secretory pathway component GspD/PulD (secretin)
VVIGGMMQESSQNMRGQVPLLGDVPVIGRLFRQQRRMTRKTELVILLRPIVWITTASGTAHLRARVGTHA